MLVVMLVAIPSAHGDPPSVRFVYSPGPRAERCPDESALRNGVAARLGRDPFRDDAATVLTVSVVRDGRAVTARVEVRDTSGVLGERELSSRENDCSELTEAMELAIAIAIDPLALAASAPVSAPERPEAQPERQPRVVRVDTPPPAPVHLHGSVGLLAAFESAPSVAAGAAIQVGMSRQAQSLTLEIRADLPASMETAGGSISSSLLLLSLLPCLHLGNFAGCAVVGVGALRGAGHDLPDARQLTSFFATVGARGVWRLRLSDSTWLDACADLLAPVTRTSLSVGARAVWSTPAVSGAAGLRVGVSFS